MRLVTRLLIVAAMVTPIRARAALTAVADFGANPGALDMFEYIPAGLAPGRPLVVVMHGCTQTAAAMEAAGWNALADAQQFGVLYPQQRSANQALSCFSWYLPGDTARGGGEAASILAMVDKEIATHGFDPQRVYATGISAGAAFTAVMLAAYPDRFAAGSIMSGIPYRCADDLNAATGCTMMAASSQKTPAQWSALVRGADPGFAGPYPRVQIWQGTSDYTVYPANATELVKQWTDVWGIGQTASATDTISTATRTQYTAGATVAVELYLVTNMGHAIAIGSDAIGACPATAGAYFADEQICSTLRAAQFFGLIAGGPGSGSNGGSGDGGVGDDGGNSNGGCTTTPRTDGVFAIAIVGFALRRRRRRD